MWLHEPSGQPWGGGGNSAICVSSIGGVFGQSHSLRNPNTCPRSLCHACSYMGRGGVSHVGFTIKCVHQDTCNACKCIHAYTYASIRKSQDEHHRFMSDPHPLSVRQIPKICPKMTSEITQASVLGGRVFMTCFVFFLHHLLPGICHGHWLAACHSHGALPIDMCR